MGPETSWVLFIDLKIAILSKYIANLKHLHLSLCLNENASFFEHRKIVFFFLGQDQAVDLFVQNFGSSRGGSGTFHWGCFIHQICLEKVAVEGEVAGHEVDQVYLVFNTLDVAELDRVVLKGREMDRLLFSRRCGIR